VVKGLFPDKRKRTALDEEFSRLDVGHIKPKTQYFVHMKTVPSSEYYKEDCQAPGLEKPEGDHRWWNLLLKGLVDTWVVLAGTR
jgi:hypothetical protein